MKRIPEKKLEKILHFVEKPGRYIGEEINFIKKPFNNSFLKIALCYPDIYEVGMSNFSLRILYETINSEKNLLAERVFMPGLDMQDIMKKNGLDLFSLESKHFIKDFGIFGFTIQYELNYLPVLQILKLSNIPIWTSERTDNHPLIIAGGAGLANPEPIADFIDFFLIGDADDVIVPLLNKIDKWQKQRLHRINILENLNEIEYIYVPSLNKKKIKRHIVPDLNKIPHPVKQIVPLIDIVQNRGIVEIDRGCINNCRFCQAGYYYRPKRERDADKIINIVEKIIQHTGYNIITLLSLSISNYSYIYELIHCLNNKFQGRGISFSLPSIRIDKFTVNLLDELSVVRKSGLTFALESADEEIQKSINKKIDIENFIETIIKVARRKWRTIKIYFMIGFTKDGNETDKIKILIDNVIERLKKEGLFLRINLHISTLIKKPLTPLEEEPQLDFKVIENKINVLKDTFYNKKYKKWLKLKGHDINLSFLDAILSRGDRKISRVLYTLLQTGYFYDSSKEKFDISPWLDAFKQNNIDYRDYIYHKSPPGKNPPWEKFDFGYKDDFFKKEYKNYLDKKQTPNCVDNKCYDCGICQKKIKNKNTNKESFKNGFDKSNTSNNYFLNLAHKYQYKLIFKKRGLFKYISHRDLLDVFEKIFRMIDLPAIYSYGFNKRMKISILFPPPLIVEGENEILFFSTSRPVDEEETMRKINSILNNDGFKVKKIKNILKNKKSLHSTLDYSEYLVKFKDKSLYRKVMKKLKDFHDISYHEEKELSIKLILFKDKSVTKFLQLLCNDKFPALWKDVEWIIRTRIY